MPAPSQTRIPDGALKCRNCGSRLRKDNKHGYCLLTPECSALVKKSQNLLTVYGITLIEYEARLAEQGGGCAVCGDTQTRKDRKYLYVDHDHATGEVRGLLCTNCNFAIGHAQDEPDRLIAMAAYLIRHGASEGAL
jgi:Recombination endonuclease VII